MYEDFMKSKIATRWGTAFENVIHEKNVSTCSTSVKKTKQDETSGHKASLPLKTTKIKRSSSEY